MILLQRLTFIVYVGLLVWSCGPSDYSNQNSTTPTTTPAPDCLVSGDIIVSTAGTGSNKSVFAYSSTGAFKRVIQTYSGSTASPYGLVWNASSKEVLIALDTGSRIDAVKATDCTVSTKVNDPTNLNSTVRGISVAANGDILVVRSATTTNVMRYNSNGNLVAGWPKTGLASQSSGIFATATGYVECTNTGATTGVSVYLDTGALVAGQSRTSGVTGTTTANDCRVLQNGQLATTWSGTTPTLQITNVNSGLTLVQNLQDSHLSLPRGIAERSNGNILVVDGTNNNVIEYTYNGSTWVYASTPIGPGILASPQYITIIP